MKAVVLATLLVLAVNSASVKVPNEDAPVCEVCKAAIREFKVILADKNTIDQMDMIHTWFCANFPIENCDKFWTDTMAALYDWANGLKEDYVCKLMTACATFDDETYSASFQKLFSPAAVQDNNPFCEYCHDAMNELKKVSHDPDVLIITKDLPRVVCDVVDVPGCITAMTLFFQYGLESCQNLDVNKTCINMTACKEMATEEKDTCAQCTQVADLVKEKIDLGNMSGKDMCRVVGLC